MTGTSRFTRLQAAFHEIAELPPEDREEAVRRSCGDDSTFAAELWALLAASERTASPLDAPLLQLEEAPGYRLLKVIGRGGSATVYLADQQGGGAAARRDRRRMPPPFL